MNTIKQVLAGGIFALCAALPGFAGAMSYVAPQYAYPPQYGSSYYYPQTQYYQSSSQSYSCGYGYPCAPYPSYPQYYQQYQYATPSYSSYGYPYGYQSYGCDALYPSGQPACGGSLWYQGPQTAYPYQQYQYPQYQYAGYGSYNGYGTGYTWGSQPQYYYSY